MSKNKANVSLAIGILFSFMGSNHFGSKGEIIPFPKQPRINHLSVHLLPKILQDSGVSQKEAMESKRVTRGMMKKGYRFIIIFEGKKEQGFSVWEMYAKNLDQAIRIIGDEKKFKHATVYKLNDPGDDPSGEGVIPFPSSLV